MEIIGPRYREAMSILCQIHSFSGYALLPLFSYYLRDWHHFYLAISSISFLYLIAICFSVIGCITAFNNVIVVTFAIIGLFGATLTFPNLYLYAGEIFPTVVKATGEDLCSSVGRIGSMIAPFVTCD
ncbi:hypothetical protein GQX74_005752 [Glossina fuscipes]|nr:hypothetical protein GQX74_005752 [Glossina fuscipes]